MQDNTKLGKSTAESDQVLCLICNAVIPSTDVQRNMFYDSNEDYFCKSCKQSSIQEVQNIERYNKIQDGLHAQIDEVIADKLYIGNQAGSLVAEALQTLKITHILVAGAWLEEKFPTQYSYLTIQAMDTLQENIKQYFEKCNEFIESGKRVFVHCAFGKSRSSTIVIAYLMWKNKLKFKEAYAFLKKRRYLVCPNANFKEQLMQYENELYCIQ